MINNKKGAGLLAAGAIAVLIFMAGMIFLNFIKPEVTEARSATGLDCTNSSITDGAKVSCLGVDATVPYFIIAVISAAGGIIGAKFLI